MHDRMFIDYYYLGCDVKHAGLVPQPGIEPALLLRGNTDLTTGPQINPHYKMFRSIHGLYPLDTSNMAPVLTIKNIFGYCQVHHGGKSCPWLRISDIYYVHICFKLFRLLQQNIMIEYLIKNRNLFLIASQGQRPSSRCQHSHDFHLRALAHSPSHCAPLVGEGLRESVWSIFFKGTNPNQYFTLVTQVPPKCPPPDIIILGLGFQYMNWEGKDGTKIESIAISFNK